MNAGHILVTGASGQLGQTLARLWVEAPIPQFQFSALPRAQLDIGKPDLAAAVLNELKPTVIVNAAAYTQVDKAESDSDAAYLINEAGTASLALWAAHNGAQILHISTDFVFDGAKPNPYLPISPMTRPGLWASTAHQNWPARRPCKRRAMAIAQLFAPPGCIPSMAVIS